MEMAVCYIRESFRSRVVELSSGIRRERTQRLYVCVRRVVITSGVREQVEVARVLEF
jgi:hypothetical protein